MPKTFVGIYWSSRACEQYDCTSKALDHFRLISQFGEGLDKWFLTAGRKPKEPIAADTASHEGLTGLWRANHRDIDRSVITELGLRLSLWNGDCGRASAFTSLHCGCTVSKIKNNALVQVERDHATGIGDGAAVELLKLLVDLWAADSGIVTQSTWNEKDQRRDEVEIATYERRRWPFILPKNAVRHASGLIKLNS